MLKSYKNTEQSQGTLCVSAFEWKKAWGTPESEDSRREYRTMSEPIDTEIAVIVMVDGGSASASEIVSGGLQDLKRATIMGKTTFGQGLVQSIRPLPYNGQMKITTAKYYTPSGRCVQGVGVKPDVEIDIPQYSRLV